MNVAHAFAHMDQGVARKQWAIKGSFLLAAIRAWQTRRALWNEPVQLLPVRHGYPGCSGVTVARRIVGVRLGPLTGIVLRVSERTGLTSSSARPALPRAAFAPLVSVTFVISAWVWFLVNDLFLPWIETIVNAVWAVRRGGQYAWSRLMARA